MRFRFILLLVFFVSAAQAQLRWPAITAQSKPWTRWWWMGNAVDTADLRANMSLYAAAGYGGLELTPIYGVHGYEDKFVNYLSPRWMQLFGYTLGEAKQLGLGLDMATGTGWPFGGGPLIDSNYACRELFYKTYTVKGGERLGDTVRYQQEGYVHTDGRHVTIDQLVEPVSANKDLQALALFQVRFPHSLPPFSLMAYGPDGRVLDLTSRLQPDGHLDWTAPAGGDWTLYGLFLGWHGKMVERAAPGAEGNVIDHFSSTALHRYLSRFDTAFAGHDLSPLRCFFNDSYEVDDSRGQSNWTPSFFDAFRSHRGYDLHDYLPALFGKDSPENNARVICDYRETISDLLLEQFTQPWHDWAHGKGAMIRDQAHGSPANIMDLYAASDIPETEGADILRFKFATSTAHVTGKPLASAEAVTWLGEHFVSSYADVKAALDKYWLGGVNHVVYHGTAYTPTSDPWPGWLFYAAVHFTPNDPDWRNFSVLNGYVARVQSFLQQGTSDNDILLYYPVYDSWSEPGGPLLKHYDRMEPEFSGTGFEKCAEYLLARGNGFDYISDKQLQNTRYTMNEGITTSGGAHYGAVLVPGCRYISVAAFQRLIKLAKAGALILVYDHLPTDAPGWYRNKLYADTLHKLMAGLSFKYTDVGHPVQQAFIGKGQFIMSDDLSALFTNGGLPGAMMAADSLDFVRRKYKDGQLYFIVNHGSKKWDGEIFLSTSFHSAAIFDPMTGESGLARVRRDTFQRNGALRTSPPTIYLQLAPGQSCIVQTSEGELHGPLFPYYTAAGKAMTLDGPWQLEFLSGGPVIPPAMTVQRLVSWTELGGDTLKSFSGVGKYTLEFSRPADNAALWQLDLGKVDRTAEIILNGKKLTALIGPDFKVVVPSSFIQPRNRLEIIVTNGMINRIEDLDRKGVHWKKFYNYNFPPHERANRGADGFFDASKWAPVSSGLSGPVTLTPLAPEPPEAARPKDRY